MPLDINLSICMITGKTTSKHTSAAITGKPDLNTEEEEWNLYGLSKVDLIGIGLPMLVGVPSKSSIQYIVFTFLK